VQARQLPLWPDRAALFLDLDGTMIDFADQPDAVVPSARFHDIVARLARLEHGAVAFVSGRTIAELDRLLAPHTFPVAGIHGSERRDSSGTRSAASADAIALEHVRQALLDLTAEHPGVLIEDKGVSLAMHYRQRPEVSASLAELEARLSSLLPSGYQLMRGNMVLEIKPSSADKGTAIEEFMSEPPFAGRTPVFIGDDVTDEKGFAVVNAMGGISVKVNDGQTIARWRLPDVAAVLGWLDEVLPP
jgi:trehalose 6-phosphate phosphatase